MRSFQNLIRKLPKNSQLTSSFSNFHRPLELTLAILKPHVIKYPPALEAIENAILTSNIMVVRSKRRILKREELEKFYEQHLGKFFYNRLITFMMSGPSELLILTGENVIQRWRQLLGPTKVYKAQFEAPDTIRGQFGLSDTRNACHGSDSEESARREIGLFFPDFDVDRWYKMIEPSFRNKLIEFDEEMFVHKVLQQPAG